jgi:hypothetical protein
MGRKNQFGIFNDSIINLRKFYAEERVFVR